MYHHITGKIYGYDLRNKKILISVDKALVKEIGENYFVPFVFNEPYDSEEVPKRAGLLDACKKEEKYIFTIDCSKDENLVKVSSVDVGKTVSISFNREESVGSEVKEVKRVGPEVDVKEIRAFVILE